MPDDLYKSIYKNFVNLHDSDLFEHVVQALVQHLFEILLILHLVRDTLYPRKCTFTTGLIGHPKIIDNPCVFVKSTFLCHLTF